MFLYIFTLEFPTTQNFQFFTFFCDKFFFDNWIVGLLGQFPVFGSLLSQVVGVVEHGVIGRCPHPRARAPRQRRKRKHLRRRLQLRKRRAGAT